MAESLTSRITYWQAIFDTVDATTNQAVALREHAQEDLDSYWEYSEAECAFSGFAKVTQDNVLAGARDIVYDEGVSQGFCIARFGTEKKVGWVVSYLFVKDIQQAEIDAPLSEEIYVAATTASVVPKETVEAAFEGVFLPHDILVSRSDAFMEYVNVPAFFDLTLEEQRAVVESELYDTRLQVRQWVDIIGKHAVFETDYAYVSTRDGYGMRQVSLDDTCRLGGEVVTLDVLFRSKLRAGRCIMRESDFIDSSAGFCLVIEPDRDTVRQLGIADNDSLYVPISGHDVDVSFLDLIESDTV